MPPRPQSCELRLCKRLGWFLVSSAPSSSQIPAMTEPMPGGSNIATPPADPSHPSQESCGIAVAGAKDQAVAVLNPSEKSSDAIVGHPDKPPAQSMPEKPCVEKIQPRILPLLGKPHFACIMCKSHVHPPFQVVVPRSFAPFLPSKSVPATLTMQNRSWEMRFTGGRLIQRLEAGWRSFAVDNSLRLGDGCVFELVDGERVVFRVQVLHAEIPARIRERAGGYTSSSPIVID